MTVPLPKPAFFGQYLTLICFPLNRTFLSRLALTYGSPSVVRDSLDPVISTEFGNCILVEYMVFFLRWLADCWLNVAGGLSSVSMVSFGHEMRQAIRAHRACNDCSWCVSLLLFIIIYLLITQQQHIIIIIIINFYYTTV